MQPSAADRRYKECHGTVRGSAIVNLVNEIDDDDDEEVLRAEERVRHGQRGRRRSGKSSYLNASSSLSTVAVESGNPSLSPNFDVKTLT